jgi:hypothetical protein
MEFTMKKLMLATIAALTLGAGVASAQTLQQNNAPHWQTSAPYNYDIVGG